MFGGDGGGGRRCVKFYVQVVRFLPSLSLIYRQNIHRVGCDWIACKKFFLVREDVSCCELSDG